MTSQLVPSRMDGQTTECRQLPIAMDVHLRLFYLRSAMAGEIQGFVVSVLFFLALPFFPSGGIEFLSG